MFGLHPATPVTVSAAFVFGMVLALLGSLKLALAKRLALGEGGIGGLLSALNLALIPMMLLSGVSLDVVGVKAVLVVGCVVTSLALFSLTLPLTYARAIGAVLCAGMGVAAVSTSATVLMVQAFPPRDVTASLNLGHVFIALGALVTPVLVDVLLRTLEFRRTVALLALICLVPAFLAAAAGELTVSGQKADLSGLLRHEYLWLAGLVFFFYAPLEGAISVWTTTYLTDLGQGERGAAWLLSGFWALFLASRFLVALVNPGPAWGPWLIVVPALLTAVVLGNMAGTAVRIHARAGLLVLGFLLGPVFPTLVGIVFRLAPHEQGTAYGTVFAIGSCGSLVLAPLIGARARRANVQSALRIPMVIALALTAAAVVFGLTVGHR
jgi:fucose permease